MVGVIKYLIVCGAIPFVHEVVLLCEVDACVVFGAGLTFSHLVLLTDDFKFSQFTSTPTLSRRMLVWRLLFLIL